METETKYVKQALEMAARGIPVFPVKRIEKEPAITGWQAAATTDPVTIEYWDKEFPGTRWGALSKNDGIFIVDDDTDILRDFGFKTLTIQSSKGHFQRYFRQTDASREMGTIRQPDVGGKFSVRGHNSFGVCAGPHGSGTDYKVVDDSEIVVAPDELVAFLESQRTKAKPPSFVAGHFFSDRKQITDEGIDGFCDYYSDVVHVRKREPGKWHIVCIQVDKHTPGKKPSLTESTILLVNGAVIYKCLHGCCELLNWDAFRSLVHEMSGKTKKFNFFSKTEGAVIQVNVAVEPVGEEETAGAVDVFGRSLLSKASAKITEILDGLKAYAEAIEELRAEIRAKEERLPEFPTLPGSIHDLATAVLPDFPYSFKAMAAVTRIGLALSGRTSLGAFDTLQPRFYTVMVADKWRGKTAANNAIGCFLDPICSYSAKKSVDSGPMLVKLFSRIPEVYKKILLDPDEMKSVFEKSKDSANSKNTMFSELLRLHDSNQTGHATLKEGDTQITAAHLAIIGGATFESYEQMWLKSGGGNDGLQSRFTVVSSNSGVLPIERRPTDKDAADRAAKRIERQIAGAGGFVKIDTGAYEVFHKWWEPIKDDKHSARLSDIVQRFAVVLAVTTDTQVIGADLMAVSVAFGTHVLACRERFNPDDAMSHVQQFEQRIEKAFKDGPMTDRQLLAKVRPDRRPGGYNSYYVALKALKVERLEVIKRDGKRTIWGLA
jgi:Bifunctional DNA primase/polymerase, N-terminal